jgi:phage N-6-adenine-methyltransferase
VIAPALYSSITDDWSTPPDLFAALARRHGPFTLDVAASVDNAKCERYYTREQDGLLQPWEGRCWMNPPYGKTIGQWVKKAVESAQAGATGVALLPVRTDSRWWQDWAGPFGEVEFIRGRVRFGDGPHCAPFPSAVVVFKPGATRVCRHCQERFKPRRSDATYCGSVCRQAAYRMRCVTAEP